MFLVIHLGVYGFSFLTSQVYLPALEGYVPRDMLRALHAFLEFCYIVRKDTHDTSTLRALDDALERFHQYREIFVTTGVRKPNSFPTRQHAMVHYSRAIRLFGSPNGLCSSLTESKHIDAVKKPWRRSNRFNALKQILKTNSRLDKLRAARAEFIHRGILDGPLPDDSLRECHLLHFLILKLFT